MHGTQDILLPKEVSKSCGSLVGHRSEREHEGAEPRDPFAISSMTGREDHAARECLQKRSNLGILDRPKGPRMNKSLGQGGALRGRMT
jgi:hypothetical protein